MRDLTEQEKAVLGALADAYNLAAALPLLHEADMREIGQALHVAQNIIMARPAVEKQVGLKGQVA